ncbi:MAG: TrbC/VirB2 family protein [Bacteroidales bacterium]|nr:TrbC/VirB2 family protein [Bacteroidales bacterium]
MKPARALFFMLIAVIPYPAFAAEVGANAWESILSKIANSLTGPVAYAISIMAIFLCGITMAFADLGGGAKRFVQVGCGLSIAIFASQILTSFFGFSGALI